MPLNLRAWRSPAIALPVVAAICFAVIVALPGVPALRHDWAWPASRSDLADLFARSLSGWDPRGIGGANLYLNDYAIGALIGALVFVLGSHAALFAFLAGIGLLCAFGGAAVARRFGADAWGQGGAALVAVFNPWVYTEIVAGHTYMVLAYGALACLIAECLAPRPRPLMAALLALCTVQQLQFFIAAAAIAVAVAVVRRMVLPLAALLVAGAPLAWMVATEDGSFARVPYTLAWESSQSVPLWNAPLLTGYYAGYTQGLDSVDRWIMCAVALLAAAGLLSIARSRRGGVFLAGTIVMVAMAAGLRGPLAPVVRWALEAIPPAHAFRELFDLLGFAAIGYCAGIGAAGRRAAAFVALGAGACLAISWLVWSPWRWWVPLDRIAVTHVDAAPGTRFALLPAFQPMSLVAGGGSGIDPDATLRADAVAPINTLEPSYPADAALALFERRADATMLEALGVSSVIARPYFTSDAVALGAQRALPATGGASQATTMTLQAAPMLALLPPPSTCSVCRNVGAGAVFFGDVAGMQGAMMPQAWSRYPQTVEIRPPRETFDASAAWVDARLAFAADPSLAQAFGGAVTSQSATPLPVRPGMDALVDVRGRLTSDDGALVSRTTDGYAWVPLGPHVDALRCYGVCAVALEASGAQRFPRETGAAAPATAVTVVFLSPWLARASLPAGPAATLRLNAAFDRGWILLSGGIPSASHVRLDGALNAWLLPARSSTTPIALLQWPSAVAAIFEAIGLAWILALIVRWSAALARGHDEAAGERRA